MVFCLLHRVEFNFHVIFLPDPQAEAKQSTHGPVCLLSRSGYSPDGAALTCTTKLSIFTLNTDFCPLNSFWLGFQTAIPLHCKILNIYFEHRLLPSKFFLVRLSNYHTTAVQNSRCLQICPQKSFRLGFQSVMILLQNSWYLQICPLNSFQLRMLRVDVSSLLCYNDLSVCDLHSTLTVAFALAMTRRYLDQIMLWLPSYSIHPCSSYLNLTPLTCAATSNVALLWI